MFVYDHLTQVPLCKWLSMTDFLEQHYDSDSSAAGSSWLTFNPSSSEIDQIIQLSILLYVSDSQQDLSQHVDTGLIIY